MIGRTLATKAKALHEKFPVLLITGPRQAGKTTLLKSLFSGFPYASMEDPDVRGRFLQDPRGFLENYSNGAFFDEAQRTPELFSYLQGIVDSRPAVKFILTGSQHFLMMEQITQSLAGRVAILKLLPFSVEELDAAGISFKTPEEAIFFGMYPAVYGKDISPQDFYPSYLETYVERDVRQIKNVGNLNDFMRFTKLCAGRIGQLLNISSLASDAGVSPNTARSWVSILEASFIIYLLMPHFKNYNKRLVKSPKLYFYDTGLACSLLFIEEVVQLKTHFLKGALFENFVINELLKKRLNQGKLSNLYFWRDNHGNEVDLIIESAGGLTPIEMKAGVTQSTSYFSGLNFWNKLSGNPPKNSYAIYGGEENAATSYGQLVSWRSFQKLF